MGFRSVPARNSGMKSAAAAAQQPSWDLQTEPKWCHT